MPYPYGRDRSPNPATEPLRQWVLDVKRVGAAQPVSRFLLETLEADALRDVMFDDLLIKLNAQVITQDRAEYDVDATVPVPASWWDHYKHTLWGSVAVEPGWQARVDRRVFGWLRLDRIRYRELHATLHVREFTAYPDADPADPALARALGSGVDKRIVIGPSWPVRFDDDMMLPASPAEDPAGDTDD